MVQGNKRTGNTEVFEEGMRENRWRRIVRFRLGNERKILGGKG